jgi:uncharacterized protein (TIGR02391 family)
MRTGFAVTLAGPRREPDAAGGCQKRSVAAQDQNEVRRQPSRANKVSLHDLIPDHEALLALEPEELAGIVLEYLNSLGPDDRGQLNRYNFTLHHTVREYPQDQQDNILQALMEAWVWLEREGLVVPQPGSMGEWVVVSRRGRQVRNAQGLEAYRNANLLPRRLLHPVIAQKAWANFLRGDYDTAVFQAFKEVEVRVRGAGGFADTDLGVDLMRKAFHTDAGPLTDTRAPKSEREALGHLFAGAIGSYKNPHSHRHVTIDQMEAVEMITLASHLLKIVDERAEA